MSISNKSVLVCDDSILARKQLKDTINEFSGEITIFEGKNGQDAVDVYKEKTPDLVFIDIVMPEKDGTTAIQEIMEADSSAKIIVVSSVGTQQQLKTAISAGAIDFIQKPFDTEQIKKLLNTHLGGE